MESTEETLLETVQSRRKRRRKELYALKRKKEAKQQQGIWKARQTEYHRRRRATMPPHQHQLLLMQRRERYQRAKYKRFSHKSPPHCTSSTLQKPLSPPLTHNPLILSQNISSSQTLLESNLSLCIPSQDTPSPPSHTVILLPLQGLLHHLYQYKILQHHHGLHLFTPPHLTLHHHHQ